MAVERPRVTTVRTDDLNMPTKPFVVMTKAAPKR